MTDFISVMEVLIGYEEFVYCYVRAPYQLMLRASAHNVIHSHAWCDSKETKFHVV